MCVREKEWSGVEWSEEYWLAIRLIERVAGKA